MKKWSMSFRIWHWANAVVVLGLLSTVFLRKTFLSYKENAQIIVSKLSDQNITLTLDQAKDVAKAIRAPMWDWHIYLGYALAFLLVYRTILFFTQSGRQSFCFRELNMHHKLVSLGYVGLYGALFFMAISGLAMHFHEQIGLVKESVNTIKEIHEAVFNLVLLFVPLHVAGVVVADLRDEKGIISNMIHGKGN